jgi:hypothetical protein
MSDIDLKWLLPFALPFALVAMARVLFWAAGAGPWDEFQADTIAVLSMIAGFVVGGCAAVALAIEEKKLTIYGVRDNDE